jgi:hypothetical protein
VKAGYANGDKAGATMRAFDFFRKKVWPTVRKGTDTTVAELGAQRAEMIAYLMATPDLCAEFLLRTHPINLTKYPQQVQDLVTKNDILAAAAYREGKSAISNVGMDGVDNMSQSFAEAKLILTTEEISAVRDPSNATPHVLCSAFKKWYSDVASLPAPQAAAIWRDILFPVSQ